MVMVQGMVLLGSVLLRMVADGAACHLDLATSIRGYKELCVVGRSHPARWREFIVDIQFFKVNLTRFHRRSLS